MLVDGNGNAIPNQELISGAIGNAQGSTFSILLPVPTGSGSSQTLKVQTMQVSNGQTQIVSTASVGSTLTTVEGEGVVNMLPSAVYLTAANPEQSITFSNSGDAAAQLQSLVATNPNIEIVFDSTSLASGASTTATLRLKDPTVPASSGGITLTYNNGQGEVKDSTIVEENVIPAPIPGPTPTPTPGLTAILSPDNDFFTTTAVGTVNRQMTLTNTGNTTENAIVLRLPMMEFNISAGVTNSCDVVPAAGAGVRNRVLSNNLDADSSCDVTVTYTKNTATAQNTADISIEYDYNNGTAAPTPATAAVDYRVTQSTANLTLSPSADQTYSSISSNNSDTAVKPYTLTNSGEVAATNLNINTFGGTNASFFRVSSPEGTTCSQAGNLSNTPGSNSCVIRTVFGPAANGSAGVKTATYAVSYTPYSGGATASSNTVNLAGTVTAAPSATYTSSITANTFTGGTGAQGVPFTGYTSTAYTVSVTYINNSQIAATGFTTSYSSLPTDWTLSTHGCNNAAMAATTGSCIDVYTLNSATTGSHDLNLANSTASWTDSSGTYTNQSVSGVGTVYTSLSVPPISPSVTIAPVATWSTVMGSAYAFTATVTAGSITVTPTVSGLTGNTVSPASCDLDSAGTASCVFIVTDYTGSGNYSYWDPATVANSTDVDNPTVINTYNSISLSVAATGTGTTINGSASPQTFSNIIGIVIAPYVYLPQTGQTSTLPWDVTATTGADGNVNAGIPWAVAPSGGSTVPNPRFEEVDGGACIKDNLTGLIWVKDPNTVSSGNPINWTTALTAAQNGTWCGQSAGTWRVPNVNELTSLINYAYISPNEWLMYGSGDSANPNCNGACFSNIQAVIYWSSSSYAPSNPSTTAWGIELNSGGTSFGSKTSGYNRLIPVRGGQ